MDEALAWTESVLGTTITEVAELRGGQTSTMLAITSACGREYVLRLVTQEPWRSDGAMLTQRERAAQLAMVNSAVPAPASVAITANGDAAGVAGHLMSRLPGEPLLPVRAPMLEAMAEMLAAIHELEPAEPFPAYRSWAWSSKFVIPAWSRHPGSWERAFEVLAEAPPSFDPTFLHRDYGHHNLLWVGDAISGVVDWVETSTGPAWLDAGHAATNLAVRIGPEVAWSFIERYAVLTGRRPEPYWLIMDGVGFLPPPGKTLTFWSTAEVARFDDWLHELVVLSAGSR